MDSTKLKSKEPCVVFLHKILTILDPTVRNTVCGSSHSGHSRFIVDQLKGSAFTEKPQPIFCSLPPPDIDCAVGDANEVDNIECLGTFTAEQYMTDVAEKKVGTADKNISLTCVNVDVSIPQVLPEISNTCKSATEASQDNSSIATHNIQEFPQDSPLYRTTEVSATPDVFFTQSPQELIIFNIPTVEMNLNNSTSDHIQTHHRSTSDIPKSSETIQPIICIQPFQSKTPILSSGVVHQASNMPIWNLKQEVRYIDLPVKRKYQPILPKTDKMEAANKNTSVPLSTRSEKQRTKQGNTVGRVGIIGNTNIEQIPQATPNYICDLSRSHGIIPLETNTKIRLKPLKPLETQSIENKQNKNEFQGSNLNTSKIPDSINSEQIHKIPTCNEPEKVTTCEQGTQTGIFCWLYKNDKLYSVDIDSQVGLVLVEKIRIEESLPVTVNSEIVPTGEKSLSDNTIHQEQSVVNQCQASDNLSVLSNQSQNMFKPSSVFEEQMYTTLGIYNCPALDSQVTNPPVQPQLANSLPTADFSLNEIYSDTLSLSDQNMPMKVQLSAIGNMTYPLDKVSKLFNKICEDIKSCHENDENGNIPLHKAVITNNLTKLKSQCIVLKTIGSHLNHVNFDGETALMLAVMLAKEEKSYYEAVSILVAEGADQAILGRDGYTPLHYAVKHGCTLLVKILLSALDSHKVIEKFCEDGFAPLHVAAIEGYDDIIRLLGSEGNVDLQDRKSGRTPYFLAVEEGNKSSAKILMMFGANSSKPNFAGQLPPILHSSTQTLELQFGPKDIEALKSLMKNNCFDKSSAYLSGYDVQREHNVQGQVQIPIYFEDQNIFSAQRNLTVYPLNQLTESTASLLPEGKTPSQCNLLSSSQTSSSDKSVKPLSKDFIRLLSIMQPKLNKHKSVDIVQTTIKPLMETPSNHILTNLSKPNVITTHKPNNLISRQTYPRKSPAQNVSEKLPLSNSSGKVKHFDKPCVVQNTPPNITDRETLISSPQFAPIDVTKVIKDQHHSKKFSKDITTIRTDIEVKSIDPKKNTQKYPLSKVFSGVLSKEHAKTCENGSNASIRSCIGEKQSLDQLNNSTKNLPALLPQDRTVKNNKYVKQTLSKHTTYEKSSEGAETKVNDKESPIQSLPMEVPLVKKSSYDCKCQTREIECYNLDCEHNDVQNYTLEPISIVGGDHHSISKSEDPSLNILNSGCSNFNQIISTNNNELVSNSVQLSFNTYMDNVVEHCQEVHDSIAVIGISGLKSSRRPIKRKVENIQLSNEERQCSDKKSSRKAPK